jgi:hypothetical protein
MRIPLCPSVLSEVVLRVGEDDVPTMLSISGMSNSWVSVAGQMLVSILALLSAYQDLGLRARLGVSFWLLIAMAFGISALANAIRANLWSAIAIYALVLLSAIYLMMRSQLKNSQ